MVPGSQSNDISCPGDPPSSCHGNFDESLAESIEGLFIRDEIELAGCSEGTCLRLERELFPLPFQNEQTHRAGFPM
jgi:hypothetical protein